MIAAFPRPINVCLMRPSGPGRQPRTGNSTSGAHVSDRAMRAFTTRRTCWYAVGTRDWPGTTIGWVRSFSRVIGPTDRRVTKGRDTALCVQSNLVFCTPLLLLPCSP